MFDCQTTRNLFSMRKLFTSCYNVLCGSQLNPFTEKTEINKYW